MILSFRKLIINWSESRIISCIAYFDFLPLVLWWFILFEFHFWCFQGGRFLWYEEKTAILRGAFITVAKEESSCFCYLHFWIWSVSCLCDCILTLDDRCFPSCSLYLGHWDAHMQAWQVCLAKLWSLNAFASCVDYLLHFLFERVWENAK